jgi:hypothetical protein
LEKQVEIGGTGIHSPVTLLCTFHATDHQPINLGIYRELFPEAYLHSTRDHRHSDPRLTYDHKVLADRYQKLLQAEPKLQVITGESIKSVSLRDRMINSVTTESGRSFKARCASIPPLTETSLLSLESVFIRAGGLALGSAFALMLQRRNS